MLTNLKLDYRISPIVSRHFDINYCQGPRKSALILIKSVYERIEYEKIQITDDSYLLQPKEKWKKPEKVSPFEVQRTYRQRQPIKVSLIMIISPRLSVATNVDMLIVF